MPGGHAGLRARRSSSLHQSAHSLLHLNLLKRWPKGGPAHLSATFLNLLKRWPKRWAGPPFRDLFLGKRWPKGGPAHLLATFLNLLKSGRRKSVHSFTSPAGLITRRSADAMPSGVSCRSSVLRLAFVLLCAVATQAEDLETHWRKAKLAESGRVYWWRPSLGSEDDPEVSFTMPADAWRKGQLDDGSDYLWRMDPYGQQHRWSITAIAHPACGPGEPRRARADRLPERGRGGALAPAEKSPFPATALSLPKARHVAVNRATHSHDSVRTYLRLTTHYPGPTCSCGASRSSTARTSPSGTRPTASRRCASPTPSTWRSTTTSYER